MSQQSDQSFPSDVTSLASDVSLLLRAHAEQRWLSREVVPVLRQLQQRESLPEEQVGAALAYLEVTWIEASRLAAETDGAYAELEAGSGSGGRAGGAPAEAQKGDALRAKARRYHASVRALREAIGHNVGPLVAVPDPARQHANY
jgi:hypothetical protein